MFYLSLDCILDHQNLFLSKIRGIRPNLKFLPNFHNLEYQHHNMQKIKIIVVYEKNQNEKI